MQGTMFSAFEALIVSMGGVLQRTTSCFWGQGPPPCPPLGSALTVHTPDKAGRIEVGGRILGLFGC